MSIADLHRKAGTAGEAPAFACCDYTALPGSARCRHYQVGGTCAHSDRFLCEEWERRNADRLRNPQGPGRPSAEVDPSGKPEPPAVPHDLFGNPAPELDQRKAGPAPAEPVLHPALGSAAADCAKGGSAVRGLTSEDIASFKALGVSVCLRSEDLGEVWLVPEYTGKDRRELTPEHAATIHRVLEAFPGSKVVAFDKTDKEKSE